MQLRKAIRTARNRTEAYHQLQSQIRSIFKGIFKGKRVVDNRVSAHATRLVANCIIAYNSIILNNIYKSLIQAGASEEVLDKFARVSPIAWTHILFTGRYKFRNKKSQIDLSKIVSLLEKNIEDNFLFDIKSK